MASLNEEESQSALHECRELLKANLEIVKSIQEGIEDRDIRYVIWAEASTDQHVERLFDGISQAPGVNILLHPCGDFCRIERALHAKEAQEKLSSLESWVLRSGRERIAISKGDFPTTFDLMANDISRHMRLCLQHLDTLRASTIRLRDIHRRMSEFKAKLGRNAEN